MNFSDESLSLILVFVCIVPCVLAMWVFEHMVIASNDAVPLVTPSAPVVSAVPLVTPAISAIPAIPLVTPIVPVVPLVTPIVPVVPLVASASRFAVAVRRFCDKSVPIADPVADPVAAPVAPVSTRVLRPRVAKILRFDIVDDESVAEDDASDESYEPVTSKKASKAPKKASKAPKKASKAPKKAEPKKASKPPKVDFVPAAELDVSDIMTFYISSDRDNNIAFNKVRERVLMNALSPPAGFRTHPLYGAKWVEMHTSLNTFLRERVEDIEYDTIEVQSAAGRKHCHDFDILFISRAKVMKTIRLEFKSGRSTSISSLPQVLSIPSDSELAGVGTSVPTYASFYYDNFLARYIATDSTLATIGLPTKSEYERLVHNDDYDDHPLFRAMYDRDKDVDRKDPIKVAKDAIVNESVTAYLAAYGSQLNLARFERKLIDTQSHKHYMIWHMANRQLYHDRLPSASKRNLVFRGIRNGNTVVVSSSDAPAADVAVVEYRLLLRWRNHKGVKMPMFQVAAKRC